MSSSSISNLKPRPWLQAQDSQQLIAYFRSGWAFLIPYLAAYLLYAWLRWPVNAAIAGGTEQGAKSWIPCLLHIYWALHAINLILGAIALRAWWRSTSGKRSAKGIEQDTDHEKSASGLQSPVSRAVYAALPWLCLALLFWIPGVYMEFPADPWQHYARVNEWSWLQTVTEHSAWKKSSYFLGYSLIGQISPPLLQLKWFDVYYTGCCLLLCWQYFRLARAAGLGERASFIFVLIQALTFGNNLFGFYRYYGMSSSLFAQLGAVALIRIALEYFSSPRITRKDTKNFPRNETYSLLATRYPLLRSAAATLALLPLIAYNHVQGLGIAGLGIAAVVVWRLVTWRRSMIWWLALAATVLSIATVLWYPRHALLDSLYYPQGWLTSWYGFNLLQPSSPALDRTAMILGIFGFFNLVAGVLLLRRNQAVGWLTVLPVVAICLPFIAVPFANALAADASFEGGYIIAFHRIIFAVPAGLALVALGAHWLQAHSLVPGDRLKSTAHSPLFGRLLRTNPGLASTSTSVLPTALLLLSLFSLATIPAHGWYFNRLYNTLMVPPYDLAMRHVIQSPTLSSLARKPRSVDSVEALAQSLLARGSVLTTPGIGYVLNATGAARIAGARK